MHRFPLEPVPNLDKRPKEEQAEVAAYRNEEGILYVPSVCVRQSLIAAAKYIVGKGRASLAGPVAACVMINPEQISLNKTCYEIDARPVVVPATKGRVIRYRPRIDEWRLTFQIEWDTTLFTKDKLREVVDRAGQLVGLLDFRPEKKGSFGRFYVVNWE